jgi:hypothetical protein
VLVSAAVAADLVPLAKPWPARHPPATGPLSRVCHSFRASVSFAASHVESPAPACVCPPPFEPRPQRRALCHRPFPVSPNPHHPCLVALAPRPSIHPSNSCQTDFSFWFFLFPPLPFFFTSSCCVTSETHLDGISTRRRRRFFDESARQRNRSTLRRPRHRDKDKGNFSPESCLPALPPAAPRQFPLATIQPATTRGNVTMC